MASKTPKGLDAAKTTMFLNLAEASEWFASLEWNRLGVFEWKRGHLLARLTWINGKLFLSELKETVL